MIRNIRTNKWKRKRKRTVIYNFEESFSICAWYLPLSFLAVKAIRAPESLHRSHCQLLRIHEDTAIILNNVEPQTWRLQWEETLQVVRGSWTWQAWFLFFHPGIFNVFWGFGLVLPLPYFFSIKGSDPSRNTLVLPYCQQNSWWKAGTFKSSFA